MVWTGLLKFKVRGKFESGIAPGITDRDIFPACIKAKITDRLRVK